MVEHGALVDCGFGLLCGRIDEDNEGDEIEI